MGNGVSGGGDSERNAWIGGVSARGLPAGCRGEGFGWLGSGGPDRSLNRLHPVGQQAPADTVLLPLRLSSSNAQFKRDHPREPGICA
ncbi:MAG: hypothetical protein ACI91B_003954 [Planctomycetota bacterium]